MIWERCLREQGTRCCRCGELCVRRRELHFKLIGSGHADLRLPPQYRCLKPMSSRQPNEDVKRRSGNSGRQWRELGLLAHLRAMPVGTTVSGNHRLLSECVWDPRLQCANIAPWEPHSKHRVRFPEASSAYLCVEFELIAPGNLFSNHRS